MQTRTKQAPKAIYPLSPMQQGLLFNTLYHADTRTDFVQQRYILRGFLNIPALQSAWEQVIARHDILRTQFRWEEAKQPLQIVWQQCALPWLKHDWSQETAVEQERRLQAFLHADFEQGIELKKAPLFRLNLICQGQELHQLIWSYHHILLDGWSNDIVWREVLELYEAACSGLSLKLAPSQPYKNYINWLQHQDDREAEHYWRTALEGFQGTTKLRVEQASAVKSRGVIDYQELRLELSPILYQRMRTFKEQYQITANTLVQAAWAYLLSSYSGEEDIVFGSVVAGRPGEIAGIEAMVGLFINTLPTRVIIDQQRDILSWLQAFQAQQLVARQYEHCPLADILRWSALVHEENLFESLVAFANYQEESEQESTIGGLRIEDAPATIGRSTYPLVLSAGMAEQFTLVLAYDGERFSRATAQRMLAHMELLLTQMLQQPQRSLSTLTLLTTEEEQRVLRTWNETGNERSKFENMVDVLRFQARRQPDAIALVFTAQNQQMSYAEMDRRAQSIALHLQRQGVGTETLVGVCVERSLEMVLAILGVLYAGGVYVPLDPAYPQERLNYMCENACIGVLITQKHLTKRFEQQALTLLHITDMMMFTASLEDSVKLPRIEPTNLAYIIYTSGSTGRSKGVMVSHQGLCNLVLAGGRAFGGQWGKRVLQFASLSFDASIWEISSALGMGGTLLLAPKEDLMPGPGLQRVLHDNSIHTATLTPSVLAALPSIELPDLKILITAGEACSAEIVAQWGSQRVFYNAYGPTETTVCASAGLCTPGNERPTIGGPIANMQLYVLDSLLRPLPPGVPGELYVGGLGVARGYFGRPELTAERFVPDAFSQTLGARLYKTGDYVYWRADGEIEFLGRVDKQVKLRGFRIEPGEIEVVLEQFAHIQQSVVIVREDEPGDKRLVAYIVPSAGESLDLEAVREYLSSKLPYYMVPSALMVLDALPLSPNGKVEQNQLPPPQAVQVEERQQPPRDTLEMQLVQIYEEVLKQEPLGIEADFFALGGHSLLAVRLMVEIQKRTVAPVTLSMIFQHSSIIHLAAALRSAATIPPAALVPIRAEGALPPLFLVHPANGQIACYYRLAAHLPEEQPLYGLQDLAIYHEGASEHSVEEMATLYIQEIQRQQPSGPYHLGGYSFGGLVAFEMAQQLLAQGQVVSLLVILDGAGPVAEGHKLPGETELLATIVGEAIHKASSLTLQDVFLSLEPLAYAQQLESALQLLQAHDVHLLVMEPEWLRGQVELFARRLRAAHRYRARIYPEQIVLLRATERDALAYEEDVSADLGWQSYTQRPLDIRGIACYHEGLVAEPYVQEVAAQLVRCLTGTAHVFKQR